MKLSRFEAIDEIEKEIKRVERMIEQSERREAEYLGTYWTGRKDALIWLKEMI